MNKDKQPYNVVKDGIRPVKPDIRRVKEFENDSGGVEKFDLSSILQDKKKNIEAEQTMMRIKSELKLVPLVPIEERINDTDYARVGKEDDVELNIHDVAKKIVNDKYKVLNPRVGFEIPSSKVPLMLKLKLKFLKTIRKVNPWYYMALNKEIKRLTLFRKTANIYEYYRKKLNQDEETANQNVRRRCVEEAFLPIKPLDLDTPFCESISEDKKE